MLSYVRQVIYMPQNWSDAEESWRSKTLLPEEISSWAIESINANKNIIDELSQLIDDSFSPQSKERNLQEKLKDVRKKIKTDISLKENTLDDISLSTPNSYKLQVSVPSNLNYLMKSWAAAEGRDLSSVALQCLETGLREMKSNGSIPLAAVKRYEIACEKRIALAEANKAWESHEEILLKKVFN